MLFADAKNDRRNRKAYKLLKIFVTSLIKRKNEFNKKKIVKGLLPIITNEKS